MCLPPSRNYDPCMLPPIQPIRMMKVGATGVCHRWHHINQFMPHMVHVHTCCHLARRHLYDIYIKLFATQQLLRKNWVQVLFGIELLFLSTHNIHNTEAHSYILRLEWAYCCASCCIKFGTLSIGYQLQHKLGNRFRQSTTEHCLPWYTSRNYIHVAAYLPCPSLTCTSTQVVITFM